ncbi:High-affinity nitrate transporter 3.1, partial [Linum perenne]
SYAPTRSTPWVRKCHTGSRRTQRRRQNLLQVDAVSSRHATLDIIFVCFSIFSIVSLFGFFYNEKRMEKSAK